MYGDYQKQREAVIFDGSRERNWDTGSLLVPLPLVTIFKGPTEVQLSTLPRNSILGAPRIPQKEDEKGERDLDIHWANLRRLPFFDHQT